MEKKNRVTSKAVILGSKVNQKLFSYFLQSNKVVIASRLKEFMSDEAVVYHLDIGEEEEDSDDEADEDHHTRLGEDFLQTRGQVED
jgi:hypothetical protein